MEQLGKVTLATFSLFGKEITYNPNMLLMTWVVIAILVFISYKSTKNMKLVPGKLQALFEGILEFLDDITVSTLGKEDGRRYLPFIATIFFFFLFSNWIGIVPNVVKILGTFFAFFHWLFGGDVTFAIQGLTQWTLAPQSATWYSSLLKFPGIEEPSKFVNTDLAVAILVFLACQGYGIKNKGFFGYLRNFVDDPFPMKGPLIFFFWLNPFFYLNLISSVANVVSHSFRLFGNIFGGGMIIVIVSSLLKYFIVPVGLYAFFGLFAGLVQAFVFTMLAVTYIQQQQ